MRAFADAYGVSAYKLTKALPKELKGTLPSIRELEEGLRELD